MLLFLFLLACSEQNQKNTELSDESEVQAPFGFLKIEEVYYSGSVPTAGIDRYYSDQFIQLRNTSDEYTIDIGGVGIGDIFGLAGEINAGYGPNSLAEYGSQLYFENMWQIPVDTPFRYLPPGGCLKIAQDAADHTPYSPYSHLDAHFETYVEQSGQDLDDPIVENLESIHYTAGYDWLVTVFGPTIVIIEPAAIEAGVVERVRGSDLWVTPSEYTLDTMEALMDENSGDFKRLHPDIDSGFQYVSGTYTGESVRRKVENGIWIDTDNSSDDFYVTQPISDCGTE
ncbi:MAG: DUF4876 domain-containing protein [Myxococcota bacterium]